LIFINQIRHKIGGLPFANKETTTGGNALKFYASVRLDVRRIATLKKGDNPIGNRVLVKVVKNKVAPPFKKVEVDIIFGEGISRELGVLDMAIKYNVIQKSGAWLAMGDEKLAQGRDNFLKKLKEDKDLYEKILKEINKVTNTIEEK
jgi:recombination protein RecA